MKKFASLTIKELKELLTPQMILPLLLSIAVFMIIGQIAGSQVAAIEKEKIRVALIDKDRTEISRIVKLGLEKQNFKVIDYRTGLHEAIAAEIKEGGSFLIYIPEDFSESIKAGRQGVLKLYVFMSSFSLAGVQKSSMIKAVIQGINDAISNNIIQNSLKSPSLGPDFVKNPVKFVEYVRINEREASGSFETIINFVSNQSSFIPIIMTIIIIISSQSVATAIASEKENKTLETLLASPVSRSSIALAKMLSSGFVALSAAAFYLIGFRTYLNSVTGGALKSPSGSAISKMAESLGLNLGFTDYVLLGASIFLSVMIALSISIVLGSFADSVKSVQAVVTPIMILILIPYLLTLFVDLNQLPLLARSLVYAIPFTHTLQAVQNLFFSRCDLVVFGIVYQALVFACMLFLVRNLFHSDMILTARPSFLKRR